MISSMNKWLIFALLATFSIGASAQDVRYYKLSSTRIGGTTNKNVSGGQFITFVSDICFESNNKGVGVNHGTMRRNDNYSNSQYTVYQGSSYWGSSTTFKFNADKSVLNVVLDNGDIYVYKRSTPPTGQTTCSLIRQRSSSSGSSGTYTTTPTYPVQQYPQQQYPQQQYPQQQQYDQPQPTPTTTHKCRVCNGTGRVEKMLAGSDEGLTKWCSECHAYRSTHHYHGTCETCRGKGYL